MQRRNVVFGMLSRLRRAHPLTCALLREENQKFLAREVVGVLPRYPRLSDSVRHVVEREGMAADVPALRLALRGSIEGRRGARGPTSVGAEKRANHSDSAPTGGETGGNGPDWGLFPI